MGQINKTTAQLNAILQYLQGEQSGDDAGLQVINGQFTVGEPGDGKESVFGEGDSYPVTKAFHCTIGNTSGLTITSATDITDDLQSDSGSTVGLFGGVAAGDYILVGAANPYGGVKVKTATAGTVESDNILAEFLADNTPTWTYAPFMSCGADFPYTQRANIVSSVIGSEQWRFGFDPDNLPTPWDVVTININGTDYSYKWARFRITATITLDPVIEQVKLHTNRFEINADGLTEYFGRSRYQKDLPMHWHLTEQLSGYSPANENIEFGSGLVLVYTDNEFIDNATDGRGGHLVIPSGLDTSIPLKFEILWQPLSNNSGGVRWSFETVQKVVGDLMDTSEIPVTVLVTETISSGEDNILKQTEVTFLANKLVPGDIIGFGLKRLGLDSADTYPDHIALINVRCVGYFWRP